MRKVRLLPIKKGHKVNVPIHVDIDDGEIDIANSTMVRVCLYYRPHPASPSRTKSRDLPGNVRDLLGIWSDIAQKIEYIVPTVAGVYNLHITADINIGAPGHPIQYIRAQYETPDIQVT